jgi:putative spermidine/putrescine transport system ATP-binding protein
MKQAAQKPNSVEFDQVCHRYGSSVVLQDFCLRVNPGELVWLLGPSGCGKTTALRAVAGLVTPRTGRIKLGAVDITRVPSNRRGVGMVFQTYSLFPHLTCWENVAFGLRLRKASKRERIAEADRLLDLVGLSALKDRYPSQVSGGQRQRIALLRALAVAPRVLLLDEPFSALDAKVRQDLRDELRRIQRENGLTAIFVTHDQEEALAISDRVAVMQGGRIEQIGTPAQIYAAPDTRFVAKFVGASSTLLGSVSGPGRISLDLGSIPVDYDTGRWEVGGRVEIVVRPEAVRIQKASKGTAVVTSLSFAGNRVRATATCPNGAAVEASVPTNLADDLTIGAPVDVFIERSPIHVAQAGDGTRANGVPSSSSGSS